MQLRAAGSVGGAGLATGCVLAKERWCYLNKLLLSQYGYDYGFRAKLTFL